MRKQEATHELRKAFGFHCGHETLGLAHGRQPSRAEVVTGIGLRVVELDANAAKALIGTWRLAHRTGMRWGEEGGGWGSERERARARETTRFSADGVARR